jgi:hypothetical protein
MQGQGTREWMKKITVSSAPVAGVMNRLMAKIPTIGQSAAGELNKGLAHLAWKTRLLPFNKVASEEDLFRNWEMYLDSVGSSYEVLESGPSYRVYKMNACPAGHCKREHLSACRATMELDHTVVELSGGKLNVLQSIPEGFDSCIQRVEYNKK